MIYHPSLRLTFGRLDLLLNYPDGRPYITFLYVTSPVCLTLPSDPTSQWTPLRSANASLSTGRIWDFNPIGRQYAWHTK